MAQLPSRPHSAAASTGRRSAAFPALETMLASNTREKPMRAAVERKYLTCIASPSPAWSAEFSGCVSSVARAAEGGERRLMQAGAVAGEAAEDHVCHVRRGAQGIDHRRDRDASRTVGGETVDAGG